MLGGVWDRLVSPGRCAPGIPDPVLIKLCIIQPQLICLRLIALACATRLG